MQSVGFSGINNLSFPKISFIKDYSHNGINKLLSQYNEIELDEGVINIGEDIVVPENKTINIRKGVSFSGPGKLLFKGRIQAGPYQIFPSSLNIKLRPYAAQEIYPEWFGAVPMDNPRATSIGGQVIDSTNAFKKALSCIESASYGTRVYGVTIKLSGWYAITDELVVNQASVRFKGTSPVFEGTGLKWIGQHTTATAEKSIIKFTGADFGGVENVGFMCSHGAPDDSTRLKAAINIMYIDGQLSQRRLIFRNIQIGDGIGYFASSEPNYYMTHGIYCGDGKNGNNDFIIIDQLLTGGIKIGIRISNNQALDWSISQYGFTYGEVMFQTDTGGGVRGNNWYAAASTRECVIKALGTQNDQLRIEIDDMSSEHLQSDHFIYATSLVRGKFTNGYIWFDGTGGNADSIEVMAGSGLQYASQIELERVTFICNNSKKLQLNYSGITGFFNSFLSLKNCAGIYDLYIKTPDPLLGGTLELSIDGSHNTTKGLGERTAYRSSYRGKITGFNANIVSGLIKISDLFNSGDVDLNGDTLRIGEKAIQPIADIRNKSFRSATIASQMLTVSGAIPGNCLLLGVRVHFVDSNFLYTIFHKVYIGTSENVNIFGKVTAPNPAGSTDGIFLPIPCQSPLNIILRAYKEPHPAWTFTQSGDTITCSGSFFEPSMVNKTIYWTSGEQAGGQYTIISYISPTQVTVNNSDTVTSGSLYVDAVFNAGARFVVTATYMEFGDFSERNANWHNSLPSITAS
jgi:hypothetical protein